MNIINWLIKFLGGFTSEEFHSLEHEFNSQRELGIQSRVRVDFLERELKSEREERKQLQEIIFKKFGIIASEEVNSQEEPELQPVSNGSQRWSNLRARLEKDDSERFKQTGDN